MFKKIFRKFKEEYWKDGIMYMFYHCNLWLFCCENEKHHNVIKTIGTNVDAKIGLLRLIMVARCMYKRVKKRKPQMGDYWGDE